MRVPGLRIVVDTDELPWLETSTEGIRWYRVGGGEARTGGSPSARETTALIRMEPGCGYPPHRHVDVEEVLVLAGAYRDALGVHRAGDYVRYEAGSAHAPRALGDPALPASDENPACVLYATARAGVELL